MIILLLISHEIFNSTINDCKDDIFKTFVVRCLICFLNILDVKGLCQSRKHEGPLSCQTIQ